MARVAGVDLPREKRGEVAVTYIYGLGRSTGRRILLRFDDETPYKCIGSAVPLRMHSQPSPPVRNWPRARS